MRNLFFVLSPLQVICAQEARETFCRGEENHLIIIDRTPPGTGDYDQKTVEMDGAWDLVTRHAEAPKRGWRRNFQRLRNTLRIYRLHGRQRGKVFLGDPFINWFAMLARRLGTEVIWLDDGAASINVIKKFRSEGKLSSANPTTPKFFTIFASDRTVAESNGAVAHNELAYLRASGAADQQIEERKGLFIGQWLSERGGVTLEAEIAHLRAACDHWADVQMTYVCHRHDSPQKRARIAEFMDVVQYDQSLERALLEAPVLPRHIVSWYSSCLFTLNRLYPELNYNAIMVPTDQANPKQTAEWMNVYDAFDDLGIEITHLRPNHAPRRR